MGNQPIFVRSTAAGDDSLTFKRKMLRSANMVTTLRDLTPDFFSECFGKTIGTVESERIGVGLLGTNIRCSFNNKPNFSSPADPPASVVVKLPSEDEQSRATGIALRIYEREVGFYREIASTVRIRVPHCFHHRIDVATGDFVLVLEDCTAAQPGDQIEGCTLEAAETALVALADLHWPRWNDPSLHQIEWISRRTEESAAFTAQLFQMFLPKFLEDFAEVLSDSDRTLMETLAEVMPRWLANGPTDMCVTHGDYRLDNLLFGPDYVVALDWQTVGHGAGVSDASYFIGGGLEPGLRRLHERELVATYHSALTRKGVSLSFDDCWEQYRWFSPAGLFTCVVASSVVGETGRSHQMFAAMARRHLAHAHDSGVMQMIG